MPPCRDPFQVKRRELLLDLVFEIEVQRDLAAGMAITNRGNRLTRVVVAVVVKEDNLAADLLLHAARGDNFRVEKAFRKKAARLLTETDNRIAHAGRKTVRCKTGASNRTAAQPMALYQ